MEIRVKMEKPQIIGKADLTISHEVMTGKSLLLLYVIDGKVTCSEFAAENKASMDGLANAFRSAASVAKEPMNPFEFALGKNAPCKCKGKCKGKERS